MILIHKDTMYRSICEEDGLIESNRRYAAQRAHDYIDWLIRDLMASGYDVRWDYRDYGPSYYADTSEEDNAVRGAVDFWEWANFKKGNGGKTDGD